MAIRHVVIIGNGVAGFAAARQLRRHDHDLTISILSDEAHPFYLRSRLRDFICNALDEHEMILESRNLYRREKLNLLLQTPVAALDTVNREVVLGSGERIRWDRLLLAMGCRPRPLEIPGGRLQGVFSLRTLADAQAIRTWAQGRRRAVVLGEGVVSLQLAEALACAGLEVDYLVLGDRLWPEVLDETAGGILEYLLRDVGVRIHKHARVVAIHAAAADVKAVELEDGSQWPCDLVGHGCSFRPATDILENTAVACRDGVVVDARLETTVPGIFAAGDVVGREEAREDGALGPFRWQNSFHQGEVAARNILGAEEALEAFSFGIRTQLCDLGVAVLGHGNLSTKAAGVTVEQSRHENHYRRLVFQDEIFVGAILLGDVEHAPMLEEHIRQGATRSELQATLLPALLEEEPRLEEPLQTHCPICTDAVTLPAGTLIGHGFACRSCGNRLRLTYSEGRLAVVPEEE
jgi:NAD(P)H-nitrite reductase large subunit